LQQNFEHARALLLRLEHESTSIKVASRKQAVQADLRAKRELVKKLQARVQALDQASDSDSEEEDTVDEEQFDEKHALEENDNGYDPNVNYDDINGTNQPDGNEVRRRGGGDTGYTGYTTGIQSTTRPKPSSNVGLEGREKTLMTDRVEQEEIMDSLLSLTRELKSSASGFHGSIESERSILEKASKGLDKNVDGMDAAGKRMGTLRRMTEGKGFFGRLKLYGIISLLWLIALVLVFVMPKLRF
jgi:hypothetical protein